MSPPPQAYRARAELTPLEAAKDAGLSTSQEVDEINLRCRRVSSGLPPVPENASTSSHGVGAADHEQSGNNAGLPS